jgi:hypothetical protein
MQAYKVLLVLLKTLNKTKYSIFNLDLYDGVHCVVSAL